MSDSPVTYPERFEIVPLVKPPDATVRVPGSKSITNRALVLSALSCGNKECVLRGALQSEDTEVCLKALQKLGFHILAWHFEDPFAVEVTNPQPDQLIPRDYADLFVGNSGTTMRFLTAMVSLGQGRYRLDGIPRMRERPIGDLLDALGQLGAQAFSEQKNGCPPVVVNASGLPGGRVQIKGNLSSQFLSGLLMVTPLANRRTTIEVVGPLVSQPYVTMTLAMMRQFGANVETPSPLLFRIPPGQRYEGLHEYQIEPDASAASYFFAAAAVSGGQVKVWNLSKKSLQGDMRFVDLLAEMGCRVEEANDGITVHGGPLRGIDVDMNDISDTVMTLGAVALFADGPTTIRNVAHIRHKETDRLAALATELRRVGAEVEEFADGLRITPRPLHGAEIETYNDHRMAMSLALVGLKVSGIVIKNPGCVAKTYPDFFSDLEKLRHAASPR
jgi:3-phosphoshikimate 1-carboxyvinyltransferase